MVLTYPGIVRTRWHKFSRRTSYGADENKVRTASTCTDKGWRLLTAEQAVLVDQENILEESNASATIVIRDIEKTYKEDNLQMIIWLIRCARFLSSILFIVPLGSTF